MNTNTVLLIKYSLNYPRLEMNKVVKNRIIKNDSILNWIMKESEQHCIMLLARKMAHYKDLFPHSSHDGFIIWHSYKVKNPSGYGFSTFYPLY